MLPTITITIVMDVLSIKISNTKIPTSVKNKGQTPTFVKPAFLEVYNGPYVKPEFQ
jgi:hypothetical protein